MTGNPQKKPSFAKSVALGGIFSALAVVFLLVGGLIQVGTFVAPIFAGICLLPIAIDIGTKWALLCYAVVSILGFLLVPDQELVLFFIVLLGYFPILQPTLNKLKSRILRTIIKLLLFNASVAAVYSIMLFLFTSPELAGELAARAPWFWAGLLAVANVTFVLYDILLDRVRIIYMQRIRRSLFR